MRLACAFALVLLVACGSEPGASSTASPALSPSPAGTTAPSQSSSGPWAVMVHRAGVGEPYFVQLVTMDGQGGPWTQATSRSSKTFFFSTPCPPGAMCAEGETANYRIPETSISATHVYFLDGETEIKSLAPDGAVAVVQNINAPANSQVVFAVSPDDRRIAVSVITLATGPLPATSFSDQMYVADLASGLNRVDIYSSTQLAEWPVGWHQGALVVAIGSSDIGTYDNPYGATGYYVVDPATGRRVASLDCAFGLLVEGGSACATGWCAIFEGPCVPGTLARQAWDGTKTGFGLPAGSPAQIVRNGLVIHLSPDGTRLAAEVVTDQQAGKVSTLLFQNRAAGIIADGVSPQGWLDNTHLVVSSGSAVEIVDVAGGPERVMTGLKSIPQQGMPVLAGLMPANLG